MEELAEGFFKMFLRFIRFLLVEALCQFVAYWVGSGFLFIVTLGRYPTEQQGKAHEGRIILTGIIVIIAIVSLISWYL